jgi:hypothetical protein
LKNGTLALFAFLKVALQLAVANGMNGYGYFRDELYYVACGEHLDYGYVDHPALSIWIVWLSRALLGDSPFALRIVPALAGGLTVWVIGKIAAEIGGGPFAQALACTAALVAPVYLAVDSFYSMNALDVLFWALAVLVLVRTLRTPTTARWALLGLVLGLGLTNKISVLWLGAGIAVGLVLTSHRRHLRTAGPYFAAAIAAAFMVPYIVWNARHDWATLEFMRNATQHKMVHVTPLEFMAGQILALHPLNALIWIAGLLSLLFGAMKAWRVLAWIWLTVVAILVSSGNARGVYLAGAYPALLAAGSVAWELWLSHALLQRLRPVAIGLLILGGAVTAPLVLPVLPVEEYAAYAAKLGYRPRSEERTAVAEQPQLLADRHGWEEMAEKTAIAYRALPASDRERVMIFAQNYGEAGAIDLIGRRLGLPRASSPHNNYWIWGPSPPDPKIVLIVGGRREDHLRSLESVEPAATIECRGCMPYERNLTVWVGRGLKVNVADAWARERKYN